MSLSDHYKRDMLEDEFQDSSHLQLFEDWYAEYLHGDYKDTTIQPLLSYAKTWIIYCEERDIDITAASESDLKRFIRRRQGTISDSALSSQTTALRKWHGWLVEIDVRDDDPAEDIALGKMFNSYNSELSDRKAALRELYAPDELSTISPKDVDTLAQYCGAPRTRNELLIRLGFQSTMRPIELAWSEIDNIDWDERSIYIRTAKADPDHEYYHRYVFWHRDLDALMYRWLGGPDADGGEREAFSTHKDSPYIFITRKKPQMRSEYVSRIVREAAERSGIQQQLGVTSRRVPQEPDKDVPLYQISGHELRRAGITHYVNHVDSMDLHEVQAIAGHEKIEQTRKYVEDDWSEIKRKMRRVTF